jgi:2-keto-3-deoxy-L-rhamnonate aldolase RhmA
MSKTGSLKKRIHDGEIVVALRVPIETERDALEDALGKGDYDLIYLDGQHSPWTEFRLVEFCNTAEELGLPVQMRIPHTRNTYLIGRYLDLGLAGILVPEAVEEATVEEAIACAYYPQFGKRSVGGANRFGLSGRGTEGGVPVAAGRVAYGEWWNEHVVLGIQLESVEAIDGARALAKPGLDYVAFGPNDLMYSLEGHPHYPLRTVDDCMRNVARQLEGTGVRLGMAVMTEPDARETYLEMGITIFQEAPRP